MDITTLWKSALLAGAVIAGIASRFICKKTDNTLEEMSEEVIKHETGFDIDLSPDTKEEKDN